MNVEENVWVQFAERYLNEDEFDALKAPLRVRWTYENGCVLKALLDVWKLSHNDEYLKYVCNCMETIVEHSGRIVSYDPDAYNLDNINEGKVLLELYSLYGVNEPRYEAALHHLIAQLERQPKTSSGGFWHKQIYPNQMWLDGIYMAGPFMARYAHDFQQPDWFDTVVEQIRLIYEQTRDNATGLLYHAWDESHKQRWANPVTGCSPHFWGRAMGWFSMALVDVLEYLPSEHPGRMDIESMLENLVLSIIDVQDKESGLWHQVLNLPHSVGNYTESSCTSMFIYTLAKGVRIGVLDHSVLQIACRAYEGLLKRKIRRDTEGGTPHLTSCNAVAGLGGNPYRDGSYDYYVSEPVVNDDPKGVSAFIMASVELNRVSSL